MIGVRQVETWVRRRRALRRRFNPYVVGTPVFERSLFFGREALTRVALARLGRGSVSVVGEHRIGKTSFLHHLRSVLLARSDGELPAIPVFVDLESLPGVGLLQALLEETSCVLAAGSPKHAELQLEAAAPSSAWGQLQLCARLLDDLGRHRRRALRLVYLIDEADTLADEMDLAETLAALSAGLRTDVRFVVAGARSRAGALREPGHDEGTFEEVTLTPLSWHEGEALVRCPVSGVFDFEAAAVRRILDRSRLRPYLIQKLSARAVDRMLDDGRTVVRGTDVDAVAIAT